MRDISTLTKEEAEEFFNALNIGQIEIEIIGYNEEEKCFEVNSITEWCYYDDNEEKVTYNQEDTWYFYQDYYESDFPENHRAHQWTYREFLLGKGFRDNKFKVLERIDKH